MSLAAARDIVSKLRDAGFEAFFAGGCVRDQLLGLEPVDYDVATSARPEEVAALFRRSRPVGAKFGVMLVGLRGAEIEVATFRTDGTYADGRRPDQVRYATAAEDAERRDFTVNGMFYDPLEKTVIDYVGGQEDLARRVIRCIGNPEDRFGEDHLRMLRAVRFAARLAFELDPATAAAIKAHAGSIKLISPERVRMELALMLPHPNRAVAWGLLDDTGLLDHLCAGVTWPPDERMRIGAIFARLPAKVDFPGAVAPLALSWERAGIRRFARALRFSNAETDAVVALVPTVHALLAGEVELADLKSWLATGRFDASWKVARAVADVSGSPTTALDRLRDRATDIPEPAWAPEPWVNGDDLVAMGVPASPLYARVLAAVYRAQRNESLADRAEAVALARRLLEES